MGQLTIPDSTPFTIDNDGTVRVKNSADLDREKTAEFNFKVVQMSALLWIKTIFLSVGFHLDFFFSSKIEAKDPGFAQAVFADVQVILEDDNDNTPTFTSKDYKGYVFVNQSVGMSVVQVSCLLK